MILYSNYYTYERAVQEFNFVNHVDYSKLILDSGRT